MVSSVREVFPEQGVCQHCKLHFPVLPSLSLHGTMEIQGEIMMAWSGCEDLEDFL